MKSCQLTRKFTLNPVEDNRSAPTRNQNSQQSIMRWQWRRWYLKVLLKRSSDILCYKLIYHFGLSKDNSLLIISLQASDEHESPRSKVCFLKPLTTVYKFYCESLHSSANWNVSHYWCKKKIWKGKNTKIG